MCKISITMETGRDKTQRQPPALPVETKKDEPQEPHSSLTVDGWVAFLLNEKNSQGRWGAIIPSLTFILVFTTFAYTFLCEPMKKWPSWVVLIILFIMVVCVVLINYFERKGERRRADTVLNGIVIGKLTITKKDGSIGETKDITPENIQNAYSLKIEPKG